MSSSKVKLETIQSLLFYRGKLTQARRTTPIEQLTCQGSACRFYQPEVVRCVNVGGSGVDVEWECQADLPELLRFGRVEVSCEGWNRPGDLYVHKGSCGLEYNLVQLETGEKRHIMEKNRWIEVLAVSFIVAVFLWQIFGCLRSFRNIFSRGARSNPRHPPPTDSQRPWYPSGGFNDSPPPYTSEPHKSPHHEPSLGPGFWSGLALGGIGTQVFNSIRHRNNGRETEQQRRPYDWERDRTAGPSRQFVGRQYPQRDRREGSADLGSLRTATTFGGSSVR